MFSFNAGNIVTELIPLEYVLDHYETVCNKVLKLKIAAGNSIIRITTLRV